tara:strand:- start:19062 stop:20099 length:1038 start_codon:yes stop_codon:yes gene_type:complete
MDLCILTNDGLPNEILDEIEIFSTEKIWNNRLKVLLFAYFQFINEAISIDADVYQLHSPELITLGLALKRKGKLVVYDAHEDLPRHILEKDWLPKVVRRPISNFIEAFMHWSLSRYDGIVSPHHHVVDNLSHINNNTVLITNFAKVVPSIDVSRSSFLKRERIICYSGTVYLHSNQFSVLDSIAAIANVRYQIAGFMDESMLHKMSQHRAFGKVDYLGRIQWEELKDFYHKAIIGLVIIDYKMNLGSKRGTFAVNKLFEYMEAGLPVICSDYDLWREIIEKYECGICVEPGNISELKSAIDYLLNNKDRAYEMGQRGRKAVYEEYNWKTQEGPYVEMFKDLYYGK